MFVIKYHAKGRRSEYFGNGKSVKNKKYALAFGENLREKYKTLEGEHCTLETLSNVSNVAEMMYANTYVMVNCIEW